MTRAGREVADDIEAFRGSAHVGISELRAIGDDEIRPGDFDRDDADLLLARRNFRRGEVARRDVVVVPEAQVDDVPAREELPHLRREDAEVRARIRRGFRTGVRRQNVQHARFELAVLVLLAPHARRQIHQRRERAIRAADGPDAGELVRIDRRVLADEADGGRNVARFLNRRLETRAERVRVRVVVAPQRAVLEVDGFREVGRHAQHAVVGDVVQPLDDFRDAAPRARRFAGLLEERDRDVLLFAGDGVLDGDLLRLGRKIGDAQTLIEERILRDVDAQRLLVRHRVALRDKTIGKPVAEAVAVEHRHGDVHVRLELDQALARVGDRSVGHALELHAVALFERLREADDVVGVHLEAERMARVADDLIFQRHRPVALRRLADDDHRTAITRIPALHRLHDVENL